MDLEIIVLSEIRQKKITMISLMWDIRQKAINELTKQKSHRYRQQNGGFQRGRGLGEAKWVKKVKYKVTEGD